MKWWDDRHHRRAIRQARKDAYVYCPGDVASMGWSGVAQLVDVCSIPECEFPNGGACHAVLESREIFKRLCKERNLEGV